MSLVRSYWVSIPPDLSSCQACISGLFARKWHSRHVSERRRIGRHVTAEFGTAQPYLRPFLWQEVSKIFQSRPDVVGRNVIFPLDLLKSHSAGEAPYDHGDGESRTADYWPAPGDGGFKDDPIL